ncbi:hypothetical protein FAZ15_08610 [Sphingobacterium olei]|uniref:Uncharacterized protein n=1 Tax=Sphingobacterium olei TaxID=2571155 RepID=A0A4U0P2C1_9SPHI|nr:hypothetical protein [Sphingobacterium olei]TJZ61250.1 hypothetical protein FAZ15_08610 [Sphingobacterium olei]
MKNTQKKLKAKHFRYLSKEHIKNPDSFLSEIVHQWGLNWSSNFNYLINSSLYPPMRIALDYNYGFIFMQMKQMIEIAFVIIEKCQIDPTSKDKLFQHLGKETFEAEIEDQIILPTKLLSDFCGYKSLKDWYEVTDNLLLARDITDTEEAILDFNVEYIAIRDLLVKLPQALLHIHNKGGIQHYISK